MTFKTIDFRSAYPTLTKEQKEEASKATFAAACKHLTTFSVGRTTICSDCAAFKTPGCDSFTLNTNFMYAKMAQQFRGGRYEKRK